MVGTVGVELTIFLLLFSTPTAFVLTCKKILEMSTERKFTLQDLESTQPKEMVECMAQLGREQLGTQEALFIWKSITEFYGGISNIPDSVLMLLHWVTVAITPEEYANLTLSSIDVIENFGLNYNLNDEQIFAIANRVREDFAGKEPEDYTYYDLMALRQILCGFNRSEIERIHPSAYREAALLVSKLERCNPAVLAGFGSLAVHEDAFGPSGDWSEATWKIVGVVGDYVTQGAPQRINVPAVSAQPSDGTTERNKTD